MCEISQRYFGPRKPGEHWTTDLAWRGFDGRPVKVFGCLTAVSYSFEPDWPFASSGSSFVHYPSSCKGFSTNHCRWCVVCLLFFDGYCQDTFEATNANTKKQRNTTSATQKKSKSIHSVATRDRDRLVCQSCCLVTSCLSSKCVWTPNAFVFFFLILILTLDSSKSSAPCLTSLFCFYVSTSLFLFFGISSCLIAVLALIVSKSSPY